MANNAIARENLFSLFASNLSIYHEDISGSFLCPICQNLFANNDIGRLSVAHIYPQALGRSKRTLSCSDCDNKIGSKYNRELVKEKDFHDFECGKKSMDLRAKTACGDIGVSAQITNGILHLEHMPEKSDPNKSRKFISEAIKDWPKQQFSIKIKCFNEKKRNISLLHSAYLLMFYHFGYEYVLAPTTEIVRSIINGEKGNLEFNDLIFSPGNISCAPGNYTISIIDAPSHMFLVTLPPANDVKSTICVLLPGLSKESESVYRNLLEGKKHIEGQFNASKLNLDELKNDLSNVKYKWILNKIWDTTTGLCNKSIHPTPPHSGTAP